MLQEESSLQEEPSGVIDRGAIEHWRRRLPDLIVIAFGLVALFFASRLPFGSVSQPDSGFFPILICTLIVVFGCVSLATSRSTPAAEPDAAEAAPVEGAGGQLHVWSTVAAIAVYTLALNAVGFVICTAVLVVFLLRVIGRVSWKVSLVSGVVGAALSFEVFTLLGLPLPVGLLHF